MRLTPTETDRLLVFLAAELARRRRRKGWRLNHPEALALICDEMHEAARGGASYEEVTALGAGILSEDDVLEGVADLLGTIRIECVFADGSRVLTVERPIRSRSSTTASGSHEAGEYRFAHGAIELNTGRATVTLRVENTSRHTIFVSSHYPFFEVNRRLVFDRARAWGMHLDIPAGDSVGWRPGETRTVRLVAYGGQGAILGFNELTDGPATPARLADGLQRVRASGFGDRPEGGDDRVE